MTDQPFSVRTAHLDLPALAGSFSRRLRDAGVPITAERAARFAHALALVEPVSRRRLYWTARAVLVSDSAQVKAFDSVFSSVFGGREPSKRVRGRADGGRAGRRSGPRSPRPAERRAWVRRASRPTGVRLGPRR